MRSSTLVSAGWCVVPPGIVHLASDQSECLVSRSVGVLLPVSLLPFAVGFSCSAGSVETQWESSSLQGMLRNLALVPPSIVDRICMH